MKIFPKESPAISKPVKSNGAKSIGKKKADAPVKKDISASEIREKLAARVETSDAAKALAIKNTSKKLGEGFMNDEVKAAPVVVPIAESGPEEKSPNSKDFVLNSDIAKNDPKDSNTQEKLKSVLSKGGFSFNPKERETLDKILAGS